LNDVTIWHNPRCSKSRQTLNLLEARGIAPRIRLYLQDPPDAAEIAAVAARLGTGAAGMMRLKEARAKALGLGRDTPEDRLIAAMAEDPALIERPVVLAGGHAALGRPPEAVLAIL
jgi:arsenate reductase